MAEEKLGKKEVYYDIIGGEKQYFVGRKIKLSNGNVVTERLTGRYPSEQDARKAMRNIPQ